MLGLRVSWLRASLLALAGLLLASGVTWAHGGGGGHGGGGHGGGGMHAGGMHAGGMHVGGVGHGVGIGGIHHAGTIYSPGFYRGLGYSPYFGRGYRYGLGYYGLGYGFGLGYGLGYGLYGLGYGLGYPYYGYGYGLGYPYYGYPYYGYGYSYGGGYPYYGGTYGYGAYPRGYGSTSLYSPPPSDYANFYPQPATQTPPKDNMAHLLVIVPENAELWFNGTKTNQTGSQREFVSPELTAGKQYAYDVKARWTENGKPVEQVRTVHVQANTWQTIDFTKPEASSDKEKK